MISLLSNKLIIEHLISVNSTNQTAIDFLKDNRHLDWIVAEEQLNGRGRRSNTWSSPIGGLYATRILSDEKISYSNISQLSILASVVAAQTIEEVIGCRCPRGPKGAGYSIAPLREGHAMVKQGRIPRWHDGQSAMRGSFRPILKPLRDVRLAKRRVSV